MGPISKTETIILATDSSLYSEGAIRETIRFAGPWLSKIIARDGLPVEPGIRDEREHRV